VRRLRAEKGKYISCFENKIYKGKIKISQFRLDYEFQFTDYIYGGLDMSLMLGMDFSKSNGDIKDPKSLHHSKESVTYLR
jgi:hypothetical protein